MKVLLIDQIAKVNYKYTYPLVNGLIHSGVDVKLVMDKKGEDENCVCEKFRLFNTDEKNISKQEKLSNYISSYRKIIKLLSNENYDILHTEWYILSPIDFFFIKKIKNKFKIKYVATVHDILPFNKKFYDLYFHRKLYALADKIILQAPSNMQRFESLFPSLAAKTVMVPHGHMLDYIEVGQKEECRRQLGISQDKKVFLFFGQIKKVKGLDILLRAFSLLKDECAEVFLIIAGSVWKTDFDDCQKIIEDNNLDNYVRLDIRYIPDEEVKDYYSAADICVLPYTDVYQSGVIQLAYGYKKPVISSDLPSFTQFVKENETGFVAEVGNYLSLFEKMKKAIKHWDRLEDLGINGYRRVKHDLDWNVLAEDIVDRAY